MAISTETKVGAFFLMGLVILGVFTFKVEDLGSLLKRKVTMTAHFSHASGLKEGDTVAVAGMKVGEVKRLILRPEDIMIIMSIDADKHIKEGAVATIAWGGLLGSRYIDITFGDPDAPDLMPGSDIPVQSSIELDTVLRKVDNAATQMGDMLKSANLGPKLTDLVDSLLAISADVKNQRGTIGKLLGSDELYNKAVWIADDLKATSERINKLVEKNDARITSIIEGLDGAVPEAKDAFAAIKRIGDQVETGKGILPALLTDEKMYQDFRDSLAKLTASLDRIETLTQDFAEGKGLVARLAKDEKLAEDFGQALASFREIAQRLETGDSTLARLSRDDDMYKDMKKLLDDARETLRSMKDQIPVGTFASLLLGSF